MAIRYYVYRIINMLIRIPARFVFYYPKVIAAKAKGLHRHNGIVGTFDGQRRFDNGRYVIFLIWQPMGIPWYVQNALDALHETEANVIIVANHSLSEEMRDELARQSHTIIVRDNTGFDIGGYKDATLYATNHFDIARLAYLNDSTFFFRDGLVELFRHLLDSHADICTAFENWERHHHIQSFCFSISAKIVSHPKFISFWRDYLPVSTRRWAINKGEIGLSRTIVPLSDSIEVLYGPNDLRLPLGELSSSDLRGIASYVSRLDRPEVGGLRTLPVETIIKSVTHRSQIHTGGFLFHRFCGSPIIKRDLVYRLQYSVYEVEWCLRETGRADHIEDVMAEMRRKGPGTQLPLIKKIQFLDGII